MINLPNSEVIYYFHTTVRITVRIKYSMLKSKPTANFEMAIES